MPRFDNKIPLAIMTSPKTSWTLPGFFYMLEEMSPIPVSHWLRPIVFGFDGFEGFDRQSLSDYPIEWYPIGPFEDYPHDKWSDAFLVALRFLKDKNIDVFLFMMDDFWPVRGLDMEGIRVLYDYHLSVHNEVIKIDLAFDRLYADNGRYVFGANTEFSLGHVDVIRSNPDTQYHMSLWGGLFSTGLLLKFVKPGWSAQQIELEGTPLLRETGEIVYGTRQGP